MQAEGNSKVREACGNGQRDEKVGCYRSKIVIEVG